MQQELLFKLNKLERTNKNAFKNTEKKLTQDLIKIDKKIYAPHRVQPFEVEIWKSNKTNEDKELIIFMPGLGGEINNFKWIGNELAKRGWPILFIDHRGSNLESFIEVLEGKDTIPGLSLIHI